VAYLQGGGALGDAPPLPERKIIWTKMFFLNQKLKKNLGRAQHHAQTPPLWERDTPPHTPPSTVRRTSRLQRSCPTSHKILNTPLVKVKGKWGAEPPSLVLGPTSVVGPSIRKPKIVQKWTKMHHLHGWEGHSPDEWSRQLLLNVTFFNFLRYSIYVLRVKLTNAYYVKFSQDSPY